jgi:hypothetical protein
VSINAKLWTVWAAGFVPLTCCAFAVRIAETATNNISTLWKKRLVHGLAWVTLEVAMNRRRVLIKDHLIRHGRSLEHSSQFGRHMAINAMYLLFMRHVIRIELSFEMGAGRFRTPSSEFGHMALA